MIARVIFYADWARASLDTRREFANGADTVIIHKVGDKVRRVDGIEVYANSDGSWVTVHSPVPQADGAA